MEVKLDLGPLILSGLPGAQRFFKAGKVGFAQLCLLFP
jgi:hypothetical protein